MPNGQLTFCGHRFQAESPKACALHSWGENDENRLFQRAKKGLSFELPKLFPHEKPGWEMVINSFGSIQNTTHTRTGLIDGELCFVRVLSWLVDGQPDQVAEMARVKTKELLLTVSDPREALLTHKAVVEDPARNAVKTSVMTEQDDDEYNNPFSYQKYTAFNLETAAASKLGERKAKEAKAAAQAAERLVSTKCGRKCGNRAMEVKEQILETKKK